MDVASREMMHHSIQNMATFDKYKVVPLAQATPFFNKLFGVDYIIIAVSSGPYAKIKGLMLTYNTHARCYEPRRDDMPKSKDEDDRDI